MIEFNERTGSVDENDFNILHSLFEIRYRKTATIQQPVEKMHS